MKIKPIHFGYGICFYCMVMVYYLNKSKEPNIQRIGYDGSEPTISSIHFAFKNNQLTCVQLIELYLFRIDKYDDQFNCIIHHDRQLSLRLAMELDQKKSEMSTSALFSKYPLFCIPIVLKDNIDTDDMPTTGGSVSLANLKPPHDDAAVVRQLKSQGGIILAKANLDEFAFNYYSTSTLGGQTKNAYDQARYPGGSSGGSAVAVATQFAVVGIGTDTGGSIRIPSSFNNLYGLRPTTGLIDLTGVMPLSHSRDTIGPITTNVADMAVLLTSMVSDSSRLDLHGKAITSYSSCIGSVANNDYIELSTVKIGVLEDLFSKLKDVNVIIKKALGEFDSNLVSLKNVEHISRAFFSKFKSTSQFEFTEDMNQYLANRNSQSQDAAKNFPKTVSSIISKLGKSKKCSSSAVCQRILKKLKNNMKLGGNNKDYLSNTNYQNAANKFPSQLKNSIEEIFRKHDLSALAYPTFTQLPSRLGEKQPFCSNNRLAASTGFPALTIPAGFVGRNNSIAVGLELLARKNGECTLLKIASDYEKKMKHHLPPSSIPRLYLP